LLDSSFDEQLDLIALRQRTNTMQTIWLQS